MSYIDELTKELSEIFDKAPDINGLQNNVLNFVIAKSKESFTNGLKTARKRQSKAKSQNDSKAEQK